MGKYKRIILHVGLSKTGSTSMQNNCARHSQFLVQHGVRYPSFDFEGEPFGNHSITITGAITQSPGRYGLRLAHRFPGREQDVLEACADQFSHVLSGGNGETLVLSTELVEGFDPEHASALRDRLAAATDDLRVVAFVRSPVSALASLMQERVKAGVNVSPQMLAGRVQAKCERIRQHFGAFAQFKNYHELSLHPQGLVGAWFELLGIDRQQLEQLELVNSNASLCQEAYTLMRAVNQAFPLQEQDEHKVQRFPYDLDFLMQMPGQPFVLSGWRDSQAYQMCLDESAWLQKTLGLELPEEEQAEQGDLWQQPTIVALGNLEGKIEQPAVRNTIALELEAQAQQMEPERSAESAQLRELAAALRQSS